MTQTLSMPKIYEKLSQLGLDKEYVRKQGLPSWWEDELEKEPVAVLEGIGHIAKRLHVDLSSLLVEGQTAQFKASLPHTKFKYYRQQQGSDIPDVSYQLASRIAELVADGVTPPYAQIPEYAIQIRQAILRSHSMITLDSLLDYCWQHGIAVVYFSDYPRHARKITGMVQWQYDRPVIILSSNKTQPAWLAFHLAHELGHLALGHVQEGVLIDEKIRNQESDDSEEAEANNFAMRLLIDNCNHWFRHQAIYNSQQLKTSIDNIILSKSDIDPCALAFNYAWHTNNYGFAIKAAKKFDSSSDGHEAIHQFLAKHVDWDSLSEDNADHLDDILGD